MKLLKVIGASFANGSKFTKDDKTVIMKSDGDPFEETKANTASPRPVEKKKSRKKKITSRTTYIRDLRRKRLSSAINHDKPEPANQPSSADKPEPANQPSSANVNKMLPQNALIGDDESILDSLWGSIARDELLTWRPQKAIKAEEEMVTFIDPKQSNEEKQEKRKTKMDTGKKKSTFDYIESSSFQACWDIYDILCTSKYLEEEESDPSNKKNQKRLSRRSKKRRNKKSKPINIETDSEYTNVLAPLPLPLFHDEDSTSLSESASSSSHIKQLARQIVAKERAKKLKKEQMQMIMAIDEVPYDVEDVFTPDSSDVPFDVFETVQDDGRLKYVL